MTFPEDNSVFRKPEMRVLVLACVLAGLCLVRAADDKDDVGTVIGIDLGTTYSW